MITSVRVARNGSIKETPYAYVLCWGMFSHVIYSEGNYFWEFWSWFGKWESNCFLHMPGEFAGSVVD